MRDTCHRVLKDDWIIMVLSAWMLLYKLLSPVAGFRQIFFPKYSLATQAIKSLSAGSNVLFLTKGQRAAMRL